ncbi:alkaline phosphatase family protein [candidate division KSB1 bacterium]|nr:alkaline phosphatase family protein [candidate division KSB1 bacterium]
MLSRCVVGALLLLCISGPAAIMARPQPKLVVVISIDQFRYDYLTRFEKHFVARGFNLFLKEGANFVCARHGHALNKTAAGHAVIMSGAYANHHGIISNDWYDVEGQSEVYCVGDLTVHTIGAEGEGRSPKNLMATTVGDHLRESNAGQSKVIAVSNKDRAAVLMGGKLANAAYWMIDSAFVTSSYYMADLPEWVKQYNRTNPVLAYFDKSWERLLPEAEYAVQGVDDFHAEETANGMDRAFPHRIRGMRKRLTSSFFRAFDCSPFASEVLVDFARQGIVHEQLGQRGVTDLLCLSFSANDRIGHAFGPNSHEVMDVTLRTDRLLEQFFAFLDEKIGLQNCTIILTSDHGVAPLPELLRAHNPSLEAGRVDESEFARTAEQALEKEFGKLKKARRWISYTDDGMLYLNPSALEEKAIAAATAEHTVDLALEALPAVYASFTHSQLAANRSSDELGTKMLRSFFAERSGNVSVILKPWFIDAPDGATHGQPWNYDAHVPLLWFGAGIKPDTYYEAVSIVDIAPTLAAMLGISRPSGSHGRILSEILRD